MRFFRYALIFFVVILFFLSVGVLLIQELALSRAIDQLADSIATLRTIKTQRSNYQYCEQLGTQQYDDSEVFTTQLRFTSDKDYLIEIICDQYEFTPKIISRFTLPMFAKKTAGWSGMVYEPEASWQFSVQALPEQLEPFLGLLPVLDDILLRTKVLLIKGNTPILSNQAPSITSIGPETVCAGYGYSCCDPVQSIGIGVQRPGTDCPEFCYEQCQPRPIVLSFSAEPGFDRYQRVLQIPSGTQTNFTFVTDVVLPDQSQVRIDFGDGSEWLGTAEDNSVMHQYTCTGDACSYRAIIEVVDAFDNQSVLTPITEMQVMVSQ